MSHPHRTPERENTRRERGLYIRSTFILIVFIHIGSLVTPTCYVYLTMEEKGGERERETETETERDRDRDREKENKVP